MTLQHDLFQPAAWSDPSIWAGLLTCPDGEAELWAYRHRRDPSTFLRILRGRRCATLDRCMAEIAAALQLPYCTQPTWPSLRENLSDGDYPPADRGIILITGAQRLLQRHPDDFRELAAILHDMAAGQLACRPTGPAAWRVVFHCELRFRPLMENRFEAAAIKWGGVVE